GIEITLGSGPGWSGSGGPWVRPEQSMQHLVAGSTEVKGPVHFDAKLPVPEPRSPYFPTVTKELQDKRQAYFEDVAVLAYPTPNAGAKVEFVDEKALYYRAPFSSARGVKPYLPAPAEYPSTPRSACIDIDKVIDLTNRLKPDGILDWEVPAGDWTIMRFVSRNNGANTRPAPQPGYGFECDKFSSRAFDEHFDNYIGKLLKKVGLRKAGVGWTMLHIDSWEMGAQNWTQDFREEFSKRRGYDPQPFYPAYTGIIVGNLELTERFLWDLRLTGQELVLENHARHLKSFGRKYGLGLSIEPYDMNPTADLDLGAIADVPMCEFWSPGYFNTIYSCIEGASVAHTMGRPVLAAEAFTAGAEEAWQQYPGSMKNQGDWAFCMGINRFVYHTFAHKPLGQEHRPGMTMGPYGVHWDRGQTWWSMAADYHRYITRCSYMLRQGAAVADVLYLTPAGAPHVFQPPPSALDGDGVLADKRGYSFDGCSPNILIERAQVRDGCISFPGGTTYRLLVLSGFDTMLPAVLRKIEELVNAGATIVGSPPLKSPSLVDYPRCDRQLQEIAMRLWGSLDRPATLTERKYGKGRIYWGGPFSQLEDELYPGYEATAELLAGMGVPEDFAATGPVRYTHRRTEDCDIYFVANKSPDAVRADCTFRSGGGRPELWIPVTGDVYCLRGPGPGEDGRTTIPMRFEPYESFFAVFSRKQTEPPGNALQETNFPEPKPIAALNGPWDVSFDTKWGGPQNIVFEELVDWTQHSERGIKYYSGLATYRKSFDLPDFQPSAGDLYLDLGAVCNLARIHLNGKDFGVAWTAPWRIKITDAVRAKDNRLEIEVANLWTNRLLGDQQQPDANVRTVQWPSGLLEGRQWPAGRYTFTTKRFGDMKLPLLKSGLLGPVTIQIADFKR
ncbi:MAG: glycosyl hydrolase, partial [Planctomycetota bacterium]